jgi:hypothetical protein
MVEGELGMPVGGGVLGSPVDGAGFRRVLGALGVTGDEVAGRPVLGSIGPVAGRPVRGSVAGKPVRGSVGPAAGRPVAGSVGRVGAVLGSPVRGSIGAVIRWPVRGSIGAVVGRPVCGLTLDVPGVVVRGSLACASTVAGMIPRTPTTSVVQIHAFITHLPGLEDRARPMPLTGWPSGRSGRAETRRPPDCRNRPRQRVRSGRRHRARPAWRRARGRPARRSKSAA